MYIDDAYFSEFPKIVNNINKTPIKYNELVDKEYVDESISSVQSQINHIVTTPGQAVTPVFSIGTVSSTSTPSVSINNSIVSNPVLNFGLVKGNDGSKGDSGITPSISIGNITSGNSPNVSLRGTLTNPILDFQLVKGQDGSKGDSGTTPSISIGNVISGTSPNVSLRGTLTNPILDFQLVTGSKGDSGITPTLSFSQPTTLNAGSSCTISTTQQANNYNIALGIPKGFTPSFKVGTVTQLAGDQQPTITFSTPSSTYEYTVNFGIPVQLVEDDTNNTDDGNGNSGGLWGSIKNGVKNSKKAITGTLGVIGIGLAVANAIISSAEFTALQGQITSLGTRVTILEGKVTNIELSITDIEVDIGTLQDKTAYQTALVDNTRGQLTRFSSAIAVIGGGLSVSGSSGTINIENCNIDCPGKITSGSLETKNINYGTDNIINIGRNGTLSNTINIGGSFDFVYINGELYKNPLNVFNSSYINQFG